MACKRTASVRPPRQSHQAVVCFGTWHRPCSVPESPLTPGRYVGAAEIEDDGIDFEDKMGELSQTLYGQMKEAEALDNTIRQNLEVFGYGVWTDGIRWVRKSSGRVCI